MVGRPTLPAQRPADHPFADRSSAYHAGISGVSHLPAYYVTLEAPHRTPHRSERRNPLVAATLFIDYLVERYGTGTSRIIEACRAAGLPDPEFEADAGALSVTLRRAIPAAEQWAGHGLTRRQLAALEFLNAAEAPVRLTNTEYQSRFGVSKATATRELNALTKAGALRKVGTRGAGVHYVLVARALTSHEDASRGQ